MITRIREIKVASKEMVCLCTIGLTMTEVKLD